MDQMNLKIKSMYAAILKWDTFREKDIAFNTIHKVVDPQDPKYGVALEKTKYEEENENLQTKIQSITIQGRRKVLNIALPHVKPQSWV